MKFPLPVFSLLALCAAAALPLRADTYVVTVAGLGGEPEYVQSFTSTAHDLDTLFKSEGPNVHVATLTGDASTRAGLTDAISAVARAAQPADDFILILIGHGSFDGVEYKFNLVGPDISGAQLATLCDRVASRHQLIVDTTSASGGAVPALERPGRAVIAATKSGTEKNATVFARYFLQALQDPDTDTDKNEAVSALEAFQAADRKTADFYSSQKRLATEHPVFEDTGKYDAVRAPSDENREGMLLASITLVRWGSAQKAALNPAKQALLAQKDELERQIDVLNYQKAALSADDYKTQITALLLQLAKIQAQIDQ